MEKYQKALVKSIEHSEDAYLREKWERIEENRRKAAGAAPGGQKGQAGAF